MDESGISFINSDFSFKDISHFKNFWRIREHSLRPLKTPPAFFRQVFPLLSPQKPERIRNNREHIFTMECRAEKSKGSNIIWLQSVC